jgi:hypothetical protein
MNALSRHDGSGPFVGGKDLFNLVFGPFFIDCGSEVPRVKAVEGEGMIAADDTVDREMLHEDDQIP